jgi:hypothetical protein
MCKKKQTRLNYKVTCEECFKKWQCFVGQNLNFFKTDKWAHAAQNVYLYFYSLSRCSSHEPVNRLPRIGRSVRERGTPFTPLMRNLRG